MLHTLEGLQATNEALESRYADKLQVNPALSRQLVSFQANKGRPGYRWFKYKEAFSEGLVGHILDRIGLTSGKILDPFAGSGTALFAASERGLDSLGIELLPVGIAIIHARKLAQGPDAEAIRAALRRWRADQPWQDFSASRPFPHLRITQGAFSPETESGLARYLAACKEESDPIARFLRFAALCVLEEISYTRKDGQYLRWDYRSGRRQGATPFDKGPILPFEQAITQKLDEMITDLGPSGFLPGFFDTVLARGAIETREASCLDTLPTLETASIDGIITSPPYANRYDYTRTYALELAMLGSGEADVRALRQTMVSCTVENRDKTELQHIFSPEVYQPAQAAFEGQGALTAILQYLERQKEARALNNTGIPRMVRNYFWEMALVIFECARILRPNAPFVMVNDNVRYSGATIPVDLILSDFAAQAGLTVEKIWVLPTRKGNSSQQMGEHGREALRKCVYVWRKGA